jgi:ubiquitin thioesterase protein OTUB1
MHSHKLPTAVLRFKTQLPTFSSASAEYENGSQVFVTKISNLQTQYGSMRRTRGDGNCFFRSFIYGYLEWLLVQQQEQECQRWASLHGTLTCCLLCLLCAQVVLQQH